MRRVLDEVWSLPSRFPHQPPDGAPLHTSQLPGLQLGEGLLQTQAELVVPLKQRSGGEADRAIQGHNLIIQETHFTYSEYRPRATASRLGLC